MLQNLLLNLQQFQLSAIVRTFFVGLFNQMSIVNSSNQQINGFLIFWRVCVWILLIRNIGCFKEWLVSYLKGNQDDEVDFKLVCSEQGVGTVKTDFPL